MPAVVIELEDNEWSINYVVIVKKPQSVFTFHDVEIIMCRGML